MVWRSGSSPVYLFSLLCHPGLSPPPPPFPPLPSTFTDVSGASGVEKTESQRNGSGGWRLQQLTVVRTSLSPPPFPLSRTSSFVSGMAASGGRGVMKAGAWASPSRLNRCFFPPPPFPPPPPCFELNRLFTTKNTKMATFN